MKFIPDLSSHFETIKDYRYSITLSLFILCALVSYMPHPLGLESVTGSGAYAAGVVTFILLFSISAAMILVKDFWPWFMGLFK